MNGDGVKAYRDATHVSHRKMAGVTSPSFRCVKCRQTRRIPGRKHAVSGAPKYGFVCAGCAA